LIAAAGGAIVKCESPDAEGAAAWATARCKKRHGTTIEPEAAWLLVNHIGPDLGRIDSELAKLALFDPGPPAKPITTDLVRAMVGVTREEEFWSIQRTLLSGDPDAALRHLREAIEVSRHDPVALTWSFTDLARKVHGAAQGLARGQSPGALRGPLRLFGGMEEPVFRIARRIGPDRAAALFKEAVETDARQKTGSGDPVRNLESLTIRFARAFA
jgi:DNA polymerase-3 subunit delta